MWWMWLWSVFYLTARMPPPPTPGMRSSSSSPTHLTSVRPPPNNSSYAPFIWYLDSTDTMSVVFFSFLFLTQMIPHTQTLWYVCLSVKVLKSCCLLCIMYFVLKFIIYFELKFVGWIEWKKKKEEHLYNDASFVTEGRAEKRTEIVRLGRRCKTNVICTNISNLQWEASNVNECSEER